MIGPMPPYPESTYIKGAVFDRFRCHRGDGDMWPITWAADGHLYGAAGDNSGSPMNFWRIIGEPQSWCLSTGWSIWAERLDNLPVDPTEFCQRPGVDPKNGVKPAGLLSVAGVIYFAVELHNYGDNPAFNRQHNISAFLITTDDCGKSWNREASPGDFFTGRLASPHFLQFGQDYEGARDEYVYAYFPAADDGNSYWENGDCLLLGRVHKERISAREAWGFFTGGEDGVPCWSRDGDLAQPVFRYPAMTGENHVSYNRGLGRYIMGNYGFLDEDGKPRPYHAAGCWPQSCLRSQLALFEAPEPWGPWAIFHRDDNWGTYGDYQPNFPTKWMSGDGRTMLMVSSGSFDDYNLTIQKVTLSVW